MATIASAISRPAWLGLITLWTVFGSSAPLLAQETRTLSAAGWVPLHSTVDVFALPTPLGAIDPDTASPRVKLRRRPDPEGLQQWKDSPDRAPHGLLATPDAIEDLGPRADAQSSPLSLVSSFEGLANADNAITGLTVVPSDANLAVGPGHVFEMVNIVGRITDKSGGAASTFSLRDFFQVDSGFADTDPRVIYDAASNRWFATYFQFSFPQRRSSLILAVSTTSDPAGTFCLYRLGNPTFETFLQDFPQFGISGDKVIVAYNGFSFAGASLGAGYYVINKSDLVDCQSARVVPAAPDPSRFGVFPIHSLSSTQSLYMVMNSDNIVSSALVLFTVTGVPGVTTVMETSTTLGIRPWSVPPDAVQPGSIVRLETGDASVLSAVWQGGSLWLAGNEGCMSSVDTAQRSCLRVVQIQTDLSSVQQDMTFGSVGQYYYYPALSPDGAGNLFVVFTASSATDFAGVRVTGRLTSDPPNMLLASTLIRAGGGAQTASGRMGDYSGAAIDPADPSKVWVTAEYVRSSAQSGPTRLGDWGTYVAQLTFIPGPPPTLSLALNKHAFTTGDMLQVSLTVANPGAGLVVDVYFGIALPPGAGPSVGCILRDAIAFFTDGLSRFVIVCASASPSSFPPLFTGVSIPGGLPTTTVPNFFGFVWPLAPAGLYTVFMAFAVLGAFADGTIGPSDLIVVALDSLTFNPP